LLLVLEFNDRTGCLTISDELTQFLGRSDDPQFKSRPPFLRSLKKPLRRCIDLLTPSRIFSRFDPEKKNFGSRGRMDEEIVEVVREYGWYAADVSDGKPPFLYTIGLMQTCRHPEFIMFGLDAANAHALFSQLVRNIQSGQSYSEPGAYTVELGGGEHRVGFRRVHPTQHPLYLGFAMGFMTNIGRIGELEAVQAFWPDSAGKFPFDVGCDLAVYELQPRLDIGLSPREVRRFQRQWE
jgi:hypothetical protein